MESAGAWPTLAVGYVRSGRCFRDGDAHPAAWSYTRPGRPARLGSARCGSQGMVLPSSSAGGSSDFAEGVARTAAIHGRSRRRLAESRSIRRVAGRRQSGTISRDESNATRQGVRQRLMARLACFRCGAGLFATAPLDRLFADERRCPRCGVPLHDDRRVSERRVEPPGRLNVAAPGRKGPCVQDRRKGDRRRAVGVFPPLLQNNLVAPKIRWRTARRATDESEK